jgi:hypothetical protein
VEQAFEYRLSDLLGGHTRVVPSFNNEIDRILDDRLCNLPGRFIQDKSEMILDFSARMFRSGHNCPPWRGTNELDRTRSSRSILRTDRANQ